MRDFLGICGIVLLVIGAIIIASPIIAFVMFLVLLFALTTAIVAIIRALLGKPVRIVVTRNGEER